MGLLTPVEYFGLHWDGALAWLQQGRAGTNFVGAPKKTPFSNPKGMCNHLIPTAAPIPDRVHWDQFVAIAQDPLVQAMLPLPKEMGKRAYFIADQYDDLALWLTCLSRLSSPIYSVVKPAWMIKASELEKQISITNIQPWVITQVTEKEVSLLSAISKITHYAPRTVVLTGKNTLPIPENIKTITTAIRDTPIEDLMTLPLENIGATLIRRYARKEDLFAPMETRQERRARMKPKDARTS